MSRQTDTFEFISGIRDSRQVLHQNYLYNKHSGIQYRCQKCPSVLSVNETMMYVTKAPTAHIGHEPLADCRVAVMKAIKRMKERAFTDTTVSIKEIYEHALKSLTDAKFKIADINAPLIGGLLPFSRFRGTLASIRQSVVPPLPETLDDIDFEQETYQKYSLTNEGELFLRYDNKNRTKRILIFMSQCAIDWLILI